MLQYLKVFSIFPHSKLHFSLLHCTNSVAAASAACIAFVQQVFPLNNASNNNNSNSNEKKLLLLLVSSRPWLQFDYAHECNATSPAAAATFSSLLQPKASKNIFLHLHQQQQRQQHRQAATQAHRYIGILCIFQIHKRCCCCWSHHCMFCPF